MTPTGGPVGTPFAVKCENWESSNPPIVYDLYMTYNEDATRKGRKINSDPIAIN